MVRERATQTKKELMQHPGWVLNATISIVEAFPRGIMSHLFFKLCSPTAPQRGVSAAVSRHPRREGRPRPSTRERQFYPSAGKGAEADPREVDGPVEGDGRGTRGPERRHRDGRPGDALQDGLYGFPETVLHEAVRPSTPNGDEFAQLAWGCLLYTSPSPRD